MTDKQKLFIKEYLIDLNATQAAIRAGYKEHAAYSQGQRLLKNVEIQEGIQEQMQNRANKAEITAQDVLNDILDTRASIASAMAEIGDMKPSDIATLANARAKNNELLGKHLKLFTDKVDVNHSGEQTLNLQAINTDDLKKMLNE